MTEHKTNLVDNRADLMITWNNADQCVHSKQNSAISLTLKNWRNAVCIVYWLNPPGRLRFPQYSSALIISNPQLNSHLPRVFRPTTWKTDSSSRSKYHWNRLHRIVPFLSNAIGRRLPRLSGGITLEFHRGLDVWGLFNLVVFACVCVHVSVYLRDPVRYIQ